MVVYDTAEAVFRTPRGNDAVFRYRLGTNDWNTLYSCLNEDEYGLRDTPAQFAVDVGGYLGGVAIALALDYGAKVLCVEPVPPNVELIRWAVEANGLGSLVSVLQGACGDGSDVEVVYGYRGNEMAEHHAFVGNSTLAYDNPGGMLPHESATYRSLTIADIVDEYGEPDLLKLDTEGGEWAFLASGAEHLPYIVGEWHPVRGHVQRDIADLLPAHDVTFTGPEGGPGGFRAVRR